MKISDKYKWTDGDKNTLGIFKGIGPVTITLTDPLDFAFIAEGILHRCGLAKDSDSAVKAIKTLATLSKDYPIEETVDIFLKKMLDQGGAYPDCLRPLLIHILTHIEKNAHESVKSKSRL